MPLHSHEFVENYQGLIGFGYNRETDEKTIIYYLQKLSDDRLVEILVKRLSEDELEEVFSFAAKLLKKHLSESEYHSLFLKDEQDRKSVV